MTLALIELPYTALHFLWLLALLALGLGALSFGGNMLTVGAVSISRNLRIAPIVVGLTVVSIATSMPELATSLMAVRESPGLALGNIIGSNIANIGFILGLCALIAPLSVKMRMIRRETPILIGATVVFVILATGGGFTRLEGLLLLVLTMAYLIYVVRSALLQESVIAAEQFAQGVETRGHCGTKAAICFILLGTGLLAFGADILIGASVEIAQRLGASDLFIGLTIVAVGTSLPELAASLAAVRAGQGDICVGNIVGSCLFNLLLIGGAVATIAEMPVGAGLFWVEFPALMLLSGLLFFVFKAGGIVTRKNGATLLFGYGLILLLSALSQFGY